MKTEGKELHQVKTFTTYNFEVEGFHTYFVGKSGVWVHNTGTFDCDKLFVKLDSKIDQFDGDIWSAMDDLAKGPTPKWAKNWPKRWKLRMLNRVRFKYFDEAAGGTPIWRDPPGQTRGLPRHDANGRATTLEDNYRSAYGMEPPEGFTAHHIAPNDYGTLAPGEVPTPGSMKALTREANQILKDLKIDVNEVANGTYLPNKGVASFPKKVDPTIYGPRHSPTGPGYKNIHNKEYMNELVTRLRGATNSDNGRDILQRFAKDLIEGNIPGAPLQQ